MTSEPDGRTDAVDSEPEHADDGPHDDDSAEESPPPPFYTRPPWMYVFPVVLIALVWLAIGLVCSPAYFRF